MPTFAVQNKSESKVPGTRLNIVPPISTVDKMTPIESPSIQRKACCACGGGCPSCQSSLPFQAKLKIGQPNDKYEQEADRVADQVMAMPDPKLQRQPVNEEEEETLQTKPLSEQITPLVQRQEEPSEEEEELQAKSKPGETPTVSPNLESRINSMKGGGQPLDPATRNFFEPRIGYDFSQVRVHHDGQATEIARSVSARAFTLGNRVMFGSGEYAPDSATGKRLLAHELTHVVQQEREPRLRRLIQRASLADFRTKLEAISADHKAVIGDLFAHAKFKPMVKFLKKCPAGTIEFDVRRITATINKKVVDFFGGYSGPATISGVKVPGEMVVNPKRPEHATNPLEMVDTIVHEFMHALIDLKTTCATASNVFPLSSDIKDAFDDLELAPLLTITGKKQKALSRSEVAAQSAGGVKTARGKNLLEYFDENYGPSASRPETHYVDLNRKGLELIHSIISDIKSSQPTIGKETVTFDNVELFKAGDLLGSRSWLNPRQLTYSMGKHKDAVAGKRKVDKSTYTDREYQISAIQVVEFADAKKFDPNTGHRWGKVGDVWVLRKKSRFTGKALRTAVTGKKSDTPGGAVSYKIIEHW